MYCINNNTMFDGKLYTNCIVFDAILFRTVLYYFLFFTLKYFSQIKLIDLIIFM